MVKRFDPCAVILRTQSFFCRIVLMGDLVSNMAIVFELPVVIPPSGNLKPSAGFPVHIFQVACNTDAIHVSAKIIKSLIGLHKSHYELLPPIKMAAYAQHRKLLFVSLPCQGVDGLCQLLLCGEEVQDVQEGVGAEVLGEAQGTGQSLPPLRAAAAAGEA